MAMNRIIIAATLLLSLTSAPAFADKNMAPTLKILTANGFGCKAVDSGILHCSNPNTKDEYDCSQNPDAPCQGTPPAPQQTHGGKSLGNVKVQGGMTVKSTN